MSVNRITGSTHIYAIIGDPIAQAKSPELMNDHFLESGLNAIVVPFRIKPQNLADFLAFFKSTENFHGLIVTVPHKMAVVTLVDTLSTAAEQNGSVNVIRKDPDGGLHGDNFDGLGFVDGLTARGWQPTGKRCLLVGAGGAGVAIADALALSGVSEITVNDINRERRDALIAQLASRYPRLRTAPGSASAAGFELVVNCTPQGMKGSKEIPIDLSSAADDTWVADIVMDPHETPLLLDAGARGLKVHHGREMLNNQIKRFGKFFEAAARG